MFPDGDVKVWTSVTGPQFVQAANVRSVKSDSILFIYLLCFF